MTPETLWTIFLTASASFLIPALWKRMVGTRYRTEKDCNHCATKRDLAMVRKLVVELAIKAGVSPGDIARLIATSSVDENRSC